MQDVLQRVYDNGFVHEGLYEGWYCPRCADFKVENEIEEGNRCPIHHIELERHSEENYFFALSAFQERLEALYAEQPDFVTPRVRYNEALSFIKSGLQDISLSRAQLTWGVPVPWDDEPRLLRLVRRAAQLLHRPRLRAPGRGPHRAVLAGDLPRHRQGHPAASTRSSGRRC